NYLVDIVSLDPNFVHFPYLFAPTAPALVSGGGAAPISANTPSNMGTTADPLPVQFAALGSGQSASYRIVAGALLNSPNPLALASASQLPLDTAGNKEGNVLIDGHTVLNGLNGTQAAIAAPTTIRTGTGSIDIAAASDFGLLDPLAPGVVY